MNLQKQLMLAIASVPEQKYALGLRYYHGEDVIHDNHTAIILFEKAAEHGFAKAQMHLGLIYYHGWGTEINLERANH